MLIGYARVSTDDQNLNLQKDALEQANCERIFEDTSTGTKSNRHGLTAMLDFARNGDTIVIWRLDRLSRSLKDLIDTVNFLQSRGIGIKSLKELIDTSTSSGKLIFHIFGALAEFERNLIRERTQAGLQSARARGIKGGRPKSLNDAQIKELKEIYKAEKHSIKEICKIFQISKPTMYKYINT